MYQIYCDDEIIYDSRLPEYAILDGKLELALNSSGSLAFTLPRSNPSYGRIQLMKSTIKVYDDDQLIFLGRAFAPSVDLFQNDSIECEGVMAFFNDTIQPPFEYPLGSVSGFLEMILDNHNQAMPTHRKIKLGEVTVFNDSQSGHITRSSIHYVSTYQLLKEKCLDLLGGYFYFRFERDGIYLDYLSDFDLTGSQAIQQAVNVLEAKKESSASEMATAILPLGAKLKDETGQEMNKRVMITSVNDGQDYISSQEGIDTYGFIMKVTYHDNITQPENLLRQARHDLEKALGVENTISIKAADLSKAGVAVSTFLIGTYLLVEIENLKIKDTMLVRGLSIDLLRPESSHLTIGKTDKTFTHQQLSTKESITKVSQNLQEQISEKTALAVVRAVREVSSHLQQNAEEIKSEVAQKYYNKEKADELLQAIQTTITQSASAIEFQFNNYRKEQHRLFGDNASRFTELSRYIRFENGNIILGEQNSPITLRIENERIVFLESGVESAYWHNRKFYAVDGEYIHSLKLGKFAFMPRTTGNLSFTKVVN